MVKTMYIDLPSRGETDIINITEDVSDSLKKSMLKNGSVTIFIPGATGGITTVEYEEGVLQDLRTAFEKLAPRNDHYMHNQRWDDGNGFSHVRASLMGPSLTVPVIKGELSLGTWQQIIFIDFDNRPRRRKLVIQLMGE